VSDPVEAIRRVVAAFERSDWTEIDVRWGDVRVHLSTRDDGTTHTASATGTPPDEPTAAPGPAPEPAPVEAVPPAGAHVVVAPTPGIFWRAPEPGAPPFAEVGDRVERATTVCIVEVMKLMNHLKAGAPGEVVAVYAGNGEPVAQGQPLFAIAPSGPVP
jgi:acetyl-CoA carboxylase biotin carboxyl carrier protein